MLGAEIIEAALRHEPASEALWDARLSHQLDCLVPANIAEKSAERRSKADGVCAADEGLRAVYAVFERMVASTSPLPARARRRAWQRYHQFSCDYGGSVRESMALYQRLLAPAGGRKRRRGDGDADADDEEEEVDAPGASNGGAGDKGTPPPPGYAQAPAGHVAASPADYAQYYQQQQQQYAQYYGGASAEYGGAGYYAQQGGYYQ